MKPHADSPLAIAMEQPSRISPDEARRMVAKELLQRRGAIRMYRLVNVLSEEVQDVRIIAMAIDDLISQGYADQKQTWIRKNSRTGELLL